MVLLLCACRSSGSGVFDAGPDLQAAPPPCSAQADCYGCCVGRFGTGALDYDSELMSCACSAGTCATACASTVCGTSGGVDPPCRDCLAGTLVDGGACMAAATDCLVGAGPCASYADCVATCPR